MKCAQNAAYSMIERNSGKAEKIIEIFECGNGYKASSKARRVTVRPISSKWRKLGALVNLPRRARLPKFFQKHIDDSPGKSHKHQTIIKGLGGLIPFS